MATHPDSRKPPLGLPEAEWRSDTLRVDLSRLSSRERLVNDSLSGHDVQLDNPGVVVRAILDILRQMRLPIASHMRAFAGPGRIQLPCAQLPLCYVRTPIILRLTKPA